MVRFYLEVSSTSLLFFLGVFFHLLDLRVFKIFVATPVGLPRVSGFPVIIIGDPVFFDVMAGPALFGPSEKGSFIIGSNRSHMIGRIKIFMNVTAFTILINNIIILGRVKFSVKGIFNTPLGAPARKGNQEPKKYQTTDFIKSLYANNPGTVNRPSDRRGGGLIVDF